MSKPLITLILVFCILAFGNFKLLPQYQELKMLQIKVSEGQAELSSQKQYLSHLRSLSQELDKHSEELSKMDFAFPPDSNLASFFEFLQKSCSENRLILKKIGSFATSVSKENKNVKEVQIEVEVSGTFEALMGFLASLEKSARLIETSQVSFSSLPEKEGPGDVFSFKLAVKVRSRN